MFPILKEIVCRRNMRAEQDSILKEAAIALESKHYKKINEVAAQIVDLAPHEPSLVGVLVLLTDHLAQKRRYHSAVAEYYRVATSLISSVQKKRTVASFIKYAKKLPTAEMRASTYTNAIKNSPKGSILENESVAQLFFVAASLKKPEDRATAYSLVAKHANPNSELQYQALRLLNKQSEEKEQTFNINKAFKHSIQNLHARTMIHVPSLRPTEKPLRPTGLEHLQILQFIAEYKNA